MRAKIIIPAAGFASLLMLLAVCWHSGAFTPSQAPSGTGLVAKSGPVTPAIPTKAVSSRAVAETRAQNLSRPENDPATLEALQMAEVLQQVAELKYLATTGDTRSLAAILAELSNRDLEIRRTAIAAAVEFGDRAAIPALQEEMASNPEPEEKVNLQKAIDYLQLPSLAEQDSGESSSGN